MPKEAFRAQARVLENEFFARRDAEKLATLRKEIATRAERQGLAEVTGIPDEAVLQHLVEVGVTAETLAAFALVPLVTVAWADGELDAKERKAVLDAAAAHDIEEGGAAHELLTTWLDEKPDPSLRKAWEAYALAFREILPKEVVVALHDGVMTRARGVAAATGGFLGLGRRISAREQRVLDELEAVFGLP
jgi:hypothetical protein